MHSYKAFQVNRKILGRNPLSKFFFFFNFIFKLYIIVSVLPNIKMNPPQVYICSPSRISKFFLIPPFIILVYPLELQKRSAFHIASNHVPNHYSMFICPYYNMVITRATIIYVLINYWMPHLVCQHTKYSILIQHINATLDSILKRQMEKP